MLDELFIFRVLWDKNDQGITFGPNRADKCSRSLSIIQDKSTGMGTECSTLGVDGTYMVSSYSCAKQM